MPQLSRPGALLNYEIWTPPEGETGSAAPSSGVEANGGWVTLVNGHTRPLNDFRMMGRHLVQHGYAVLALDNRGAGLTETHGDFTFDDLVDDVVALWDEIGIIQTDLLGISMGGFIAQALAAQHAARVRRLVLVSTALGPARIKRDDTPWSADLAAVERKLAPYFTAEFARRNAVLVKSMVKQIAKASETGRFQLASERQRRAIHGFDGSRLARGIEAPTLVVHGDQDAVVPLAAGEELRAAVAGARLEIMHDAGHLLLAEKPRELYDVVESWFSR